MLDWTVKRLGGAAVDLGRYASSLFRHLVRALTSGFERDGDAVVQRTTLNQVYFTGVDAVPVVASLASILGGLIILQSLSLLSATGNQDLLGTLMQLVVVRELAPVMTAFIVIGRSGSSITVELGNARVARELDLLDGMGIDLYRFVVWPRLIGVTAATFALTVVFAISAVLGGFGVASLAIDTPFSAFFSIVSKSVTPIDLAVTGLKTVVFGLIVATVSTWQGMTVGRAITDVPQATRRSVVHSLLWVVVADAVLTALFWRSL